MEKAVCYGSVDVNTALAQLGTKTGDGKANPHGSVWLDSVKSMGGISCLYKTMDNLLRLFDAVWLDVRSQVCCHLVAFLCYTNGELQKLMIRNGVHK